MWEEILKLAISNGLWAVLFCCLLVYLLRDSRAREGKYQQTINVLCLRLGKLDELSEVASETLKLVKSKKRSVAENGENVAVATAKGKAQPKNVSVATVSLQQNKVCSAVKGERYGV